MAIDIRKLSIKNLGLSNRATNALLRAGYETVGDIIHLDEYSLLKVRALGENSAKEILQKINELNKGEERGLNCDSPSFLDTRETIVPVEFRFIPEYRESILEYVEKKNISVQELGLKGRPLNQLLNNGFNTLSDIIFMTREGLMALPAMGEQSINKVLDCINQFMTDNEVFIKTLQEGDKSVLWNDDLIKRSILNIYTEEGFNGLSFKDILARLDLPDDYPQENIKPLIGRLIADEELEYVDYRLYRRYKRFEEYITDALVNSDRNKSMVIRRLKGETLAEIGDDFDLTRERIRQLINKTYKEVKATYLKETGLKWFDEEYYTYFYKTYSFDTKDGETWFNISPSTWRYLNMLDVKQGKKDIEDAVEDAAIDVGLRLKIKNYVNRNKVFIDGVWVEKKRADLEEAVVKACCKENTTFTEFCNIYNEFLEAHKVEYSEKLYITDYVRGTRKNHLPNTRFLLWKQNETIRYYDVDGRDYSELFDELNLEAFENIEISTLKLMNDHADIMERYDIRDHYELHNLLRKIVPEGSFHNFKCGRMPMIMFGTFDRDAVIEEMLIENAPIEVNAFADLIHEEFGYDQATIIGTYLRGVYKYLSNGIYTVDHKTMDPANMSLLQKALTDDFYYISEVKEIYRNIIPNGDVEDVNSYNLRTMGFTVLSNYILQHYSSFEAYLVHVLTDAEIIDLKKYKKRFGSIVGFYNKMMELKRDLEIIEFEPDRAINIKKLEQSGVTKEQIRDYCDKAFDFVGQGRYLSANSIRESGFSHNLYELGFSDLFYANLLLSDERFSFAHIFGNLILYTGRESITITTFLENIIQQHGSIDMFDLINEMENVYGCSAVDRYDIVYKLKGTQVFYDNILDRMYASAELYEKELEAVEGF